MIDQVGQATSHHKTDLNVSKYYGKVYVRHNRIKTSVESQKTNLDPSFQIFSDDPSTKVASESSLDLSGEGDVLTGNEQDTRYPIDRYV